MKKTIILVVMVALLVGIFAACGGNPIQGMWYETNGFGTVEFKGGDKCTVSAMGIEIEGTYKFDAGSGEGELTMSFMGEETSSDFKLDGKELEMDGATFTRDKVEQVDMEDMMGEMMEGLE